MLMVNAIVATNMFTHVGFIKRPSIRVIVTNFSDWYQNLYIGFYKLSELAASNFG